MVDRNDIEIRERLKYGIKFTYVNVSASQATKFSRASRSIDHEYYDSYSISTKSLSTLSALW